MIKHRNRTGAGTKDDKKSIGSAEEFKEHVGHVSERVKDAYGQDNGTHKQPNSPGAKEFIDKVGRTSDRVYNTLVGISSAVIIFSGVAINNYIMPLSRELINEQQEILVEKAILPEMNRKHQAVGEAATSGLLTDRVVAKVNINKIDGNSYKKTDGRLYGVKDSWSVQLNVNLGILTKNKTDSSVHGEVLWLQDVFSSDKGKVEITSEIYHGTVRIAKEEIRRRQVLNTDSILPWRSRDLAKEEEKPVDVIDNIKGKGKTVTDMNGNDTYHYTKHIDMPTEAVHLALDIRTAVKSPHEVEISFGYAPIEKDGVVDWKEEAVFDRVTYHARGTVVGAKIGFSKIYDAGLTIDGFANGEFVYAQKLSGNLGLYESDNGKLIPMETSKLTDWQTAEWSYNVKSIVIHKGVVKLGIDTDKSKKQMLE
jgi:hypothetical protein